MRMAVYLANRLGGGESRRCFLLQSKRKLVYGGRRMGGERSEAPREGSALERAAKRKSAHNVAAFSNLAAFPTFADAAAVMLCFCVSARRSDFGCAKIARGAASPPHKAFACGKSSCAAPSHIQKNPAVAQTAGFRFSFRLLSYRAAVGNVAVEEYYAHLVARVAGKQHPLAHFSAELRGSKICDKDYFLSDKILGLVVVGDS